MSCLKQSNPLTRTFPLELSPCWGECICKRLRTTVNACDICSLETAYFTLQGVREVCLGELTYLEARLGGYVEYKDSCGCTRSATTQTSVLYFIPTEQVEAAPYHIFVRGPVRVSEGCGAVTMSASVALCFQVGPPIAG